mgnify:FL=1
MEYTVYQLAFFFFIYSFAGWCIEVCCAAIQKRKFVNRGFVNGPLCPIYGSGAVLFAVFLPELKEAPFFLFLAGAILASILEFTTGALLEKLFHRKWWDYSNIRWNYEGYVCLPFSLGWGVCAVVLNMFLNPLLVKLLRIMPRLLMVIIMIALTVALVLDTVGTTLAIRGLQKKQVQLAEFTEGVSQVSKLLENAITRRIQKRMDKAFPMLEIPKIKRQKRTKEKETVFAEGCSFYKLVSLFFIGAFLGDITETIFCLITAGKLMSRSSVVYGPFSIVWGLGCAFLTAILYRIRNKNDSYIFIAGTLLGGVYEYICSVFTELVFGTVFWDYSKFAFNLGGRINLLYCFFWGIAAVVWMKLLYPRLSAWIEKIPMKAGKIICTVMLVFMIFDCLLSAMALDRYTERNTTAKQAQNEVESFLDEHFGDERMERIYPNAKIVD